MNTNKIKIELENKELVSENCYYNVDLSVNHKSVNASVWFSYDSNIGETDRGFEILDDEGLTEEENKEIGEVIYALVDGKKWKKDIL